MAETQSGSCSCGAVRYRVTEELRMAGNCHCNTCKKLTGGAFSSIVIVGEDQLELLEGEEELTAYRVSDKAVKHFCSRCGTPIYNRHADFAGKCMVALGSLDDPGCVVPALNVFCESMLPWVRAIGELPGFDREPERH